MCSSNHGSGHDDGVEVPRSAQSLSAWWRNIAQPGSARWKAERWSVNMLRRLRARGVLWTTRRARLLSAGPAAPVRGVGHDFSQLMVIWPRSTPMVCCPQLAT